MELQAAKLVAFAIITEADAGIMGWKPGDLTSIWESLANCTTIEDIPVSLPIELLWKWDNYWSIWSAELDKPAPEPEDDQVEITEKGELALESEQGPAKARSITLTQKGEASALAVELEIKAGAEAAQQPGDKPPAGKQKRGK